jgi:hypothetical protein
MDDALFKAVEPGAPATGGRDRADLEAEAARALAHSRETRLDLAAEMAGLYSAYAAAWRYGQAHLQMTPHPAERQTIRAELARARQLTERAAQAAIRQAYARQFGLGKHVGWNWRDLDAAEDKFLLRLRREEYVFVGRFLDDIEAGRGVMPLEQRATLYGQASDEAFWWGFLYADQSADRYLRWVIGEAEHCTDCLYLAGELPPEALARYANPNTVPQGGRWGTGVYSAQELALLGVVPQSGKLRCTTNCRCHLERATRPAGKPQSRVQRVPFRSLEPKYVQPEYEARRQRYNIRRVKRDTTLAKGLAEAEEQLLAVVVADLVEQAGSIDPEDRHGSDSV